MVGIHEQLTMTTAVAIPCLAFEDLGLIEAWLRRRGWRTVTYNAGVDAFRKSAPGRISRLLVLGGPVGANDDVLYPVLAEEVDLGGQRIDSSWPLPGISGP